MVAGAIPIPFDVQVDVQGMTCGACARRVSEALKGVAGVTDAAVTLHPPRAEIRTNGSIAAADLNAKLQQAVELAGPYRITPVSDAAAPTPPKVVEVVSPGANPSFYPLLLVVGYICAVAGLSQLARGGWSSGWSWHSFMNDFMAGFFLVFSFFKLLDLRGFADAYRSYDIVARAWKPWGFTYPFVELALGFAYLARWNPPATNIITIVVMLVGSIGVLRALLSKRAIRCACLGTAIKLPMTTVTLIEDLGMALMAIAMLVLDGFGRA